MNREMKTRRKLEGPSRFATSGDGGWALPEELRSAQQSWELDEGSLFLARMLVSLVPEAKESERRALLFLGTAVLLNQRRGSTRLPLDGETLDLLFDDLGTPGADRAEVRRLLEEWRAGEEEATLSPILGRPGAYKPLILDGDQLYIQRMYRAEQELIAALELRMDAAVRAESAGAASIEAAMQQVLAAPPTIGGARILLSDEQRRAVEKALRLPLAVISGGPGTGKTSIVVSILRSLVRLGRSPGQIALAAPTGKAANRMAESIGAYLGALVDPAQEDRELLEANLEPVTLHRLLAWSPSAGRFRHGGKNPLVQDVVIVDEASMIDLGLMEQLLQAVRPDAQLILLGDAEQLPSVDAGAVLRDLVPSEEAGDQRTSFSSRLTQSYRMDPKDPAGRNILQVAGAINQGRAGRLFEASAAKGEESETIRLRARVEDLAFEKVELLAAGDLSVLRSFLERWWDGKIAGLQDFHDLVRDEYRWEKDGLAASQEGALRMLFAHFESMRLLCVTRSASAPTGVEAVNELLHQRASSGSGGQREAAFVPGEPVMMQRNDYQRGLFNGDQGLVLRVREAGEASHRFRVVFRQKGGFAVFPLEGLRGQLSLSYAMTVHKSQGSEFDTVGLILPEAPIPLLTREILYTAVTRSRRSVVVVGRPEVLVAGVEKRLERHSGIGAALR